MATQNHNLLNSINQVFSEGRSEIDNGVHTDEIFSKLKSYFKSLNQLVYIVYHVDSDFDAEFMFKSDAEFFEFLDNLENLFPGLIKEKFYRILYKTIKVDYVPHTSSEQMPAKIQLVLKKSRNTAFLLK